MIIETRVPAAEGDRFAAEAFQGQIGRTVEIVTGPYGFPMVHGRVLAAQVAADGASALLRIELDGVTSIEEPG